MLFVHVFAAVGLAGAGLAGSGLAGGGCCNRWYELQDAPDQVDHDFVIVFFERNKLKHRPN